MKSNHRHSRPHLIIWAALFLLSCVPFPSAKLIHTNITSLPFRQIFETSSSKTGFYRLDLANAPKDLDLLISVVPTTGSYSPKLFISNNKEFPEKMNDADYSSISTYGNVVHISNKDLKLVPNFLYIGLVCGNDQCHSTISVEWTKEIKAIANGEKTIKDSNTLNGTTSAIFRLTIPKEEDIERIVIHVDSITTSKDVSPSLEVFINQGMSIPFAMNPESVPRRSFWFEGSTMVIDKESSLYCNNSVLTLNLKFGQSSALSFQGEIFKKDTQLSGEMMLDGVQKGKENSYSFALKEENQDDEFILSVKVQKGKVKVFINCDTQPQSSTDYNSAYLVENSIEITLPRCSTEKYFFLVHGEESSVYSLHANYEKSNQLLMGMGKISPMTGEISPQEKLSFEILVPIFTPEEISLDLYYSQPLDLNIINCRFPADCLGLIPTKSQDKITDYYGFDDLSIGKNFTYNHSEEIAPHRSLIKIKPHKSGCYPIVIQDQTSKQDALPVCAYLVTLSNQQNSSIEYSLSTKFNGPNLLSLSEPKFDIVAKNKSIYYALYVPPNKWLSSVQIQLTKFSGDPDIFVSKWSPYPKQEDLTDVKFSSEGLIIYESRVYPLSGVIYIGVHGGPEASSFSISAIIETKPVVNKNMAFALVPGKPQKGVLLPENQYRTQYYKIFLNQDKDWKGALRITVNAPRSGAYFLANNNGGFPTIGNYMWKGRDFELEISSDDENFKSQGVYYIALICEPLSEFIYHITYSLIGDFHEPVHMLLSPNTPFYGGIKKGESHYFEAILLTDTTIFKYSDSREVELYISTDPNNKYPIQNFCTFATINQHKDYITLNASEICNKTLACSVYIGVVYSGGHKEVSYSLSMRSELSSQKSSSPIALVDGRQIQSITPRNDSPAVFYYHAIPSQNSVVTVTCPGREVVIYAKRIKVDFKSLDNPEIQPLNETTAEFTSEETDNQKGVTFISVPPLADSDVTIVAISVYFKEVDSEATFNILLSSQITQLFTGTPYTGHVARDCYVYFTVNIMRSECTLLISLTNLEEGDADLVISYGQNTRPTIANHQFAYLSDQKTEIIEINNSDISSLESMAGSWVIGVYGDTASAFRLTVVYEERKIVDLKTEVPVEMSLEASSFVYFKYLHQFERNLQINFTKFSGELNIYITSIDLNQDFVANIPDQTHYKWQNPQGALTIPMQDDKACVSCVYIMNIEAVSVSKFSLVVNELDNIRQIQSGLNPLIGNISFFRLKIGNFRLLTLSLKLEKMVHKKKFFSSSS